MFDEPEFYREKKKVEKLSYPYRHTYKCKICQNRVTTLLVDYSFYFLKLNYPQIIRKYRNRIDLNNYNLSKHFERTPPELKIFWLKLYERPRKEWVHEMLIAYRLKPAKDETFERLFELPY